ncbi:hypothetical protein H6F32_19390 [Anabaena sp. FACHB-1237]|nr:hypothetical protein [Anabaena sp. FACHB-1237]MBD2139667.1 hypothetical protein [Anabaena sp. FACHB-1237]
MVFDIKEGDRITASLREKSPSFSEIMGLLTLLLPLRETLIKIKHN